jgi:hypothetical protein
MAYYPDSTRNIAIATGGGFTFVNGTAQVLPLGTIAKNINNAIGAGPNFTYTTQKTADYAINCKISTSLNGDVNWLILMEVLINGAVSAPDSVILAGNTTGGVPATSPSLALNTTLTLNAGDIVTFRATSTNLSLNRLAGVGKISIVEI